MLKRFFDSTVSGITILFLAPLWIAVAVWIRIDSPGPAYFRQERVGRQGQLFRILKFRTMYHDRRVTGPLVTFAGDPRVTRAGRWLRRTKIDELPQLWNVVVGEMSLVGPRPEVPKYVALYAHEARELILSVRPGITDPASIEFIEEESILANAGDPEEVYREIVLPKKIELYKRYVRSRTLLGDVLVLARTLGRLVGKASSRTSRDS